MSVETDDIPTELRKTVHNAQMAENGGPMSNGHEYETMALYTNVFLQRIALLTIVTKTATMMKLFLTVI